MRGKEMFGNLGTTLKDKSPVILAVTGVGGMATSAVMAVKSTPKAMKILQDKEKEKGEPLTCEEKVKSAWRCYIPSIAVGVTSAALIFTSTGIYSKRNAQLSNDYAKLATHAEITRMALREYRDKVIETVGEEKEAEIRQAAAKEGVPYIIRDEHHSRKSGRRDMAFAVGECLCLEPTSGRYFRSNINQILDAMNRINNQINTGQPMASFNDWLYELELDDVEGGCYVGWNLNKLMKLDFYAELAPNGEPCVVIDYISKPTDDYDKL